MNMLTRTPEGSFPPPSRHGVSRRGFLKASVIAAAGAVLGPSGCVLRPPESESAPREKEAGKAVPPAPVRFGILTDPHYADCEPLNNRFYRQSLAKMEACIERMRRERVDFLVELGDFKDQDNPPNPETTMRYLRTAERCFETFPGARYHVLGNHDMDSISKAEALSAMPNTGIEPGRSYYAFDCRGVHFVVLDATFRSDGIAYDAGNFDWKDAFIPKSQLEWLAADLEAARGLAIVFVHQRLDGTGPHFVSNAARVREVLRESGKVLAVFQGHYHPGDFREVDRIPYYTLPAMVEGEGLENTAFAVVEVSFEGGMAVAPYGKARGVWPAPPLASSLDAGQSGPGGKAGGK